MEELFLRVLERFTERLIIRQREMYEGDAPFIDKWRQAMRYLDEDFESGYQKIWFELQAMAWNHPEMRERIARVNAEWREVLTETFRRARDEYGLDDTRFPVPAIVSLVYTFNQGIMLERLAGVSAGHRDLLAAIDAALEAFEGRRGEAR
jgi:AcrR family transcriptional regulator